MSEGETTCMALVHWHDASSRFVSEAVNAEGVRFYLGDPPAVIEIRAKGENQIEIYSDSLLWLHPVAENVLRLGAKQP